MKRIPARPRFAKLSSFTLVELLVVIAIIAILAGVILYAGGAAIRAAKRTKATNMATQIQTSVLNYYTEYSVYPIPTQTTAADVFYGANDVTDWENLSWALCGNINASTPTVAVTPTVSNTRGIAFMTLRSADVDANGIPLNTIYPTGYGPYFNIAMDGNYDGILGNNGTANGVITNFSTATMPTTTISQGVAVWANCNTLTGNNYLFYVHTY